MGVYDDAELQRYVSGIGERIAGVSHRPHLPWTFTVLDSPAVNAFALPGGYVYVTRGLLAHLGDEAELAGVLGHEVDTSRRATCRSSTRGRPATRWPCCWSASSCRRAAVRRPGQRRPRHLVPQVQTATTSSSPIGSASSTRSRRDGIPPAVPRFLETLSRLDALSERGIPNWLSTHPDPGSRVVKAQPVAERAAEGRLRRPQPRRVSPSRSTA